MTVSPEQFQRRVRVRLPIADRFLAGGDEAAAARRDLEQAFVRPLLSVAIPSRSEPAAQASAPTTRRPLASPPEPVS